MTCNLNLHYSLYSQVLEDVCKKHELNPVEFDLT